jgi:hypothetical protein
LVKLAAALRMPEVQPLVGVHPVTAARQRGRRPGLPRRFGGVGRGDSRTRRGERRRPPERRRRPEATTNSTGAANHAAPSPISREHDISSRVNLVDWAQFCVWRISSAPRQSIEAERLISSAIAMAASNASASKVKIANCGVFIFDDRST